MIGTCGAFETMLRDGQTLHRWTRVTGTLDGDLWFGTHQHFNSDGPGTPIAHYRIRLGPHNVPAEVEWTVDDRVTARSRLIVPPDFID